MELYASGYLRFNYPSKARFPVRGIDVSHHQAGIDWQRVQSARLDFAFIKASEGADHRDREFTANWAGAESAGIARGAYHFFTFCTPGEAQAQNFLDAVGASRGELPLAVDVEFAGNCRSWRSIDDIRMELRVFLDRIERSDGRRPVIYAPRDAYGRILAGHVEEYPLWLRNIVREPRIAPWRVWQYADNGRVPGISTLTDLNVFRGTKEEFRRWLASAPDGRESVSEMPTMPDVPPLP
jgi:lysozyme